MMTLKYKKLIIDGYNINMTKIIIKMFVVEECKIYFFFYTVTILCIHFNPRVRQRGDIHSPMCFFVFLVASCNAYYLGTYNHTPCYKINIIQSFERKLSAYSSN